MGEPRRRRDKAHLKFVAAQPCLVVAGARATPTISALPRSARSAARSATSLPYRSAAVTTGNSSCGDEALWWENAGLDPIKHAPSCGKRHASSGPGALSNRGRPKKLAAPSAQAAADAVNTPPPAAVAAATGPELGTASKATRLGAPEALAFWRTAGRPGLHAGLLSKVPVA